VQSAFYAKLPSLHLPANIIVRPAPLGQQDLMGQTLVGLGSSLVLSVVLVFLLMVALYNSYRAPLIIMFAVPVAAVGALGALWLTHETLNLYSLIGTILLVGIVTKNGILLVDYANTLRERGKNKLEAIKESAFTRFRPIMMTSISVIAGNIPLALALEPGSQVRASLGVVVIGGISSSLVLTLVLVPIMYLWLAPEHFQRSHAAPPADGSAVPHTAIEPAPVH
jgi:HAE1 family hydrophobic/amphiphilic exporter-1